MKIGWTATYGAEYTCAQSRYGGRDKLPDAGHV